MKFKIIKNLYTVTHKDRQGLMAMENSGKLNNFTPIFRFKKDAEIFKKICGKDAKVIKIKVSF